MAGVGKAPRALTPHLSSLPLPCSGWILRLFRTFSKDSQLSRQHKTILPTLPMEEKPQGRALIGLPGPDAHCWTRQLGSEAMGWGTETPGQGMEGCPLQPWAPHAG